MQNVHLKCLYKYSYLPTYLVEYSSTRHVQADCQEPGSAPERYARQSSTGFCTFAKSDAADTEYSSSKKLDSHTPTHKSTLGVHYRTGSPGQLGLWVAGFPGHWVAGSQNVTQFHVSSQ